MTYGALLDFSGGYPPVSAMLAGHYRGIVTYVPKRGASPTSNFAHVTADYYHQLRNAGLDVAFVYESLSASGDLAGHNGGAVDAEYALKTLQNMAIQPRAIYMAHDHHLATGQVQPALEYQRGAHAAIGNLAGAYGFSELIDAVKPAGTAGWYWQCGAESTLRPGVHLYQQNYGQVTVGGVQCDVNKVLLPDFGQNEAAPTTQEEDWLMDMPEIRPGMEDKPGEIWYIHKAAALLNTFPRRIGDPPVPVNGKFNQPMLTALQRFQKASHLPVTGRVDTATWRALLQPGGKVE